MRRICPDCRADNRPEAVHCCACGRKLPDPAFDPPHPAGRGRPVGRLLAAAVLLLAGGMALYEARRRVDWGDTRGRAAQGADFVKSAGGRMTDAMRRWQAKWFSPDLVPPPAADTPPTPPPAADSPPAPPEAVAPLPATNAPPAPAVRKVAIQCPRCGGVGVEGDSTARATCKLCVGAGGRELILPLDAEACTACGGMGYVVRSEHGPEQRRVCKLCAGRGFVVRKY